MSPSPPPKNDIQESRGWNCVNTLSLHLPGCGPIKMAYRSSGRGRTVLFLHEFGCSSWSWEKLVQLFPSEFTCITPDLPGCGESDSGAENVLTATALTELTARFIEQLGLREIILVGHGMGGEIALGLLGIPEIRLRIQALALISCGAQEKEIPSYIANIGHSSMTKPILNLIHSGFVIRMILKYAYAPHHTPDAGLCAHYAADLNRPGRIEALIAAARAYSRPALLPAADGLPMTIIAGDEDRILSYAAAERLHRRYPHATLNFLSGCGHIPQEECPRETVAILLSFIRRQPEPVIPEAKPEKPRKMRLSRLFDFWQPGTLFLIVILKILAFFRTLGIRVEQQSWRKISRFFLKREYSKFAIGQFRLKNGEPRTEADAKTFLERRIQDFLIAQPDLHGSAAPHFSSRISIRQGKKFCDLLVVQTDPGGNILSITPHFDPRFPQPKQFAEEVLNAVIASYNENRTLSDARRPLEVQAECHRRLRQMSRFQPRRKRRIQRIFNRIMSGTFLFYDRILPVDKTELDAQRFRMPDLTLFRHPGWGQTNIICRLTADFREADLWWQFNHTLVDGAPMQEILCKLKKEWGSAGSLIFPPLNGLISTPEIISCGPELCRARFYADFTPLLRLRSSLNRMCTVQMNGKASFAALLMWGIARHPYFHNRKMLLPVDCRNTDGKRQLGLLVTRPDRFDRGISPLNDFCQFQARMNRHLEEIRSGHAETSEMLSLFGMLHPFFYLLTQKLYPHALEEMLGTVGISIISEAEVFVSPQTDIQINGFMALGSALIQTRDNRRAGSVCISGTREQIRFYHEALEQLIRELPHLLER